MIDFEHVSKIYKRSDKPALEDIDLMWMTVSSFFW